MSSRPRYNRLFRMIAAALALLWCLPFVGVCSTQVSFTEGAVTPTASIAEALQAAAEHHAAVCHCLNCKGGEDGSLCCCRGADTPQARLALRASCDDGTTLATPVAMFKAAVFSETLRLDFPITDTPITAAFASRDAFPFSLSPAPLSPPPRLS